MKASKCNEAIKDEFKIKLEGEVENKAEKEKKNEEADDKAKFILMSTISENILRNISRKSAKDMWKSLTDKYEDTNLQNVIFLRKRFLNSKQELNETVEDFIDRVEIIKEELETVHTVEIKDEDTALTILSGLLPAYENCVQCITVNLKTAKLEDVKRNLVNEEKRRQEKRIDRKTISNENEQTFHSKFKADKKRSLNDVQCYNFDKFGHYARDCKAPKKYNQNLNKKNLYNKANVNVKDKEAFAFNANSKNIKTIKNRLLDSGATNHMSWEENKF